MSIRAVYFDLGGVILRTEDKTPRARLGAEFGLTYEEIERIVFGYGRFSSAARASVGAVTEEAHWLSVLRRLGLGPDDRARVAEAFFAGDQIDWDIVNVLRGLRQTHKVGLISNAWDGLRPYIRREKFDDAFDTMIISAEVRTAKPGPAIYQIALDALGVTPQESVFVDDFIENIEACRQLGWHGIHFRSREQALGELNALLAR